MKKLIIYVLLLAFGDTFAQETKVTIRGAVTGGSGNNIYNIDSSLSSERTVGLDGHDLAFIDTATSTGISIIPGSNSINIGGEIIAVSYGSGTVTGTATFGAAFDASGNLIEVAAVPTWQQTLIAGSTLTQTNNIDLNGNNLFIDGADGGIYIFTPSIFNGSLGTGGVSITNWSFGNGNFEILGSNATDTVSIGGNVAAKTLSYNADEHNFSGNVIFSNTINLAGYTVATLPTPVIGMMAYVTDALTPVALATVVAGGSSVVVVFYNGSNWIVL